MYQGRLLLLRLLLVAVPHPSNTHHRPTHRSRCTNKRASAPFNPVPQDLEAALAQDPDNPQITAMQERALKALGLPGKKEGSRRMAIEEVEGEAEEQQPRPPPAGAGQQEAAAAPAGEAVGCLGEWVEGG